SRLQYQQVGGHRIDRRFGELQWKVLTGAPEWQEIVVVLAAWLAALPRRVDGDRLVPVCEVEDLAVTRAGSLLEGSIVIVRRLNYVTVSGTADWSAVEQARGARCAIESVAEIGLVERAPGPALRIAALSRRQLCVCSLQGFEHQRIPGRDRGR